MNEILLQLLRTGLIQCEEDFQMFYYYHDEQATISSSEFPTTTLRIHLLEGYCQITVKENPNFRYSTSAYAFFEPLDDVYIHFFNYYDEELPSYEALQWNYITNELQRIKHQLIGKVFTIKELNDLCDNADQWNGGMNYDNFLDEGVILYKWYSIVGDTDKIAWIHFNVLNKYTVSSAYEDWELNKNVRVEVTDIELR